MGIDVQSEYAFNDLEPFLRRPAPNTQTLTDAIPIKKTAEKQTCITDTFKERKRKINPDAIEKSKEKRKRESAIIENFKYLKQSFQTASKNINQSMKKQSRQQEESLNKITNESSLSINTMNNTIYAVNSSPVQDESNSITEQFEEIDSGGEFIDKEKIDGILNEIENEMGKSKTNIVKAKPLSSNPYVREKNLNVLNPFAKLTADRLKTSATKPSSYKTLIAPKKPKPKNPKSNYTFIELLERKLSMSDDEEKAEISHKDNGFSDTIKSQIQKYLAKTQITTVAPDTNLKALLDKTEDTLASDDENTQEVEVKTMNQDSDILNSSMHSPYPRYEIKEILGGKNSTLYNIQKLPRTDEEYLIYSKHSKDCDIMLNMNDMNIDDTLSHWDTDMKASTPLRNMSTIIIDEEDHKSNSDNVVKEDNLDDTLILNIDETSKVFQNQKKIKRVDGNCNENNLDDKICVEEYNFQKVNHEFGINAAGLGPNVIMLSPTKVSDEFSNANKKDTKYQRSDNNENYFAKKTTITKDRNYNISSQDKTLLKENIGCNSLKYTKSDALEKNICSDVVLKHSNVGDNLYESTTVDSFSNIADSDVALQNRSELIVNNKVPHNKTLTIEDSYISHNHNESFINDALAKMPSADLDLKDRNQLFGLKRSSHDTTLPIENTASASSNQAQGNKSLCHTSGACDPHPSYDLMNNIQNEFSDSSKILEDYKRKTEYVKRYTYSASKVDVCTKQTPGYCVQVIKKLKMDLDITAIVSRKHNSSQNYKRDCEETSTNNNRMKIIENKEQVNAFQNTTEDANKRIASLSNEVENTSKVSLPPARFSRPEIPRVKNFFKPPYKAKGKEESENINETVINTREEYRTPDSMKHERQLNKNDIRQEELEIRENENDEETDGKLRESETGNHPMPSENKIRNLLQKYSKILA